MNGLIIKGKNLKLCQKTKNYLQMFCWKKLFQLILISFLLINFSCGKENIPQIPFDQTKWNIKEGKDYPYRNQMVDEVLYSDSLRTLNKEEVINHLGEPSYIREEFLYYRIQETRLGTWILHTKTIAIKLSEDNSVEWIKLHE